MFTKTSPAKETTKEKNTKYDKIPINVQTKSLKIEEKLFDLLLFLRGEKINVFQPPNETVSGFCIWVKGTVIKVWVPQEKRKSDDAG